MTPNQTRKNKEYTHNWRLKVGNKKRKSNYRMLIDVYGVSSKQAQVMRFWSKDRIDKWLLENGCDLIG